MYTIRVVVGEARTGLGDESFRTDRLDSVPVQGHIRAMEGSEEIGVENQTFAAQICEHLY